MTMQYVVDISAEYPGTPDTVFADARRFDDLRAAMRGLATYEGLPSGSVAREGETYVTDIVFWGLLPVTAHTIVIERVDPGARLMQSRERHRGVSRWDHRITVEPRGSGAIWRDEVMIEAGWQTPFVARFAAYTYRYRHRSRHALAITSRVVRGNSDGINRPA